MGIINPIRMCDFEFSASDKVAKPFQSLVLSQSGTLSSDYLGEKFSIKAEIYHLKFSMISSNRVTLLEGAITIFLKTSMNWLLQKELQIG